MTRYHFNLHAFGTVILDEEGIEMPDLDAVRHEAIMSARELMCSELRTGKLCLGCHIEVQDAAGQVVLTLAYKEAIELSGI
jgi:hypothetical protein